MATAEIEIDKRLEGDAGGYGRIGVRVVVLKAKPTGARPTDEPEGDDEQAPTGNSPLSSYLENPKGKQCVVFLVNGQRHHAWDNTFLSRDLPFKYLKLRTMVIIDLDGLAKEALAEVIRGSRQGLYEGDVYYAIRDRLVAMLKRDQDLDALQKDAEQKFLEMDAGDDAVKNKLDQLIDGHHLASHLAGAGMDDGGALTADGPAFAPTTAVHNVVVMDGPESGTDATMPVLVCEPRVVAVRLQDGQTRDLLVTSLPRDDWPKVEEMTARFEPEQDGLTVATARESGGARLNLAFNQPDDMDAEEYPVSTHLQVFARFKGHRETRMLRVPVVVVKPINRPPREPKPLKAEPTYLRVASRQPVKLLPGGPSVHVRLRWDGQDTLLIGAPAPWKVRARCLTLSTYPPMGFAIRGEGRLELLLDTPSGVLPGSELEFEAVAEGPGGRTLETRFKAVITEREDEDELGPRKVEANAPNTTGQRRPPFAPKYVDKADWQEGGCWGDNVWTGADVGCFQEPTATTPGFIIMNRDMGLLKAFREDMVKRKLEGATIKERVNRYYSIVGFHLYQMYIDYKGKLDAAAKDPDVKVPNPEEMRSEINRVGTSLVRIMEVSR